MISRREKISMGRKYLNQTVLPTWILVLKIAFWLAIALSMLLAEIGTDCEPEHFEIDETDCVKVIETYS